MESDNEEKGGYSTIGIIVAVIVASALFFWLISGKFPLFSRFFGSAQEAAETARDALDIPKPERMF